MIKLIKYVLLATTLASQAHATEYFYDPNSGQSIYIMRYKNSKQVEIYNPNAPTGQQSIYYYND